MRKTFWALIAASIMTGQAQATTIAGISFDNDAFVDTVISSFGTFGPSSFFPASTGDQVMTAAAVIGALNNASVAEPTTLTLFCLGLAGLGIARRRSSRAQDRRIFP
ncbi:MAG: PEP-CTERM sorting domain-containing protein [Alphaproteobacteria bacterium]|nr:PEP-CTERM sorting domain-containing protein [Alphaproteobacteria bacterium]